MSGSRWESYVQSAESLFDFVNSDMTLEEYLKTLNTDQYIEIDIENIPENSRLHEKAHADIWRKNGITYHFYKNKDTFATAPNIQEIRKMRKEDFINIMSEVCVAPEQPGIDDFVKYRILTKQIQSRENIRDCFSILRLQRL